MAVFISTVAACFWAFWGSVENFHEGWFSTSIWQNILLMFVQYLSPMLIVLLISAVVLQWPRLAIPVLGSLALGAVLFFRVRFVPAVLSVAAALCLGVLYHFGRPQPRPWAWRCLLVLPVITALVCGAYPAWLAAHRFDDGNYGMRRIDGNGLSLVWAPEGPGWPTKGVAWQEAKRRCRYLSEDGLSLAEAPRNFWRLPTVDEAVRSSVFRGQNAGGVWDPEAHRARYRVTPEKDSPLWKVHSQVIYWWTDTEADENHAYYISYNGYVLLAPKRLAAGDLAFRCVCEPGNQKAAMPESITSPD